MKKDHYYILSIVIAIITIIFLLNRLSGRDKIIEQKDSVISEKNATITYHVNDKGRIVSEKDAAVLRSKDLEESYPKIYETLKRDMDINARNLKAYIQNEFSARGQGTGSITNNHYYDSGTKTSFDSLKFKMDDGYMKFKVGFELRYFNNKLSYKQSPYSYSYSDTSKTAVHGKKKWLLGNERLYSTTTFGNPNSKITGTTNILVDNYRDKRWSISFSVGYGLVKAKDDEVHTGWFAGPSVTYSLFKF